MKRKQVFFVFWSNLLADVRQQSHESSPFDGNGDGALVGGTETAAFAREELALTRHQFFERGYVLVVDEGGPGTTFFGAKSTTTFSISQRFLPNHEPKPSPLRWTFECLSAIKQVKREESE